MLKIERCSDADSALWRRFPAQMAVAFAPLLTSRYVLKQQPPPAVPFPVYRSPSGNNYAGWLITWTGHLIDRVPHSLIPSSSFSFHAVHQRWPLIGFSCR